MFVQKCEDVINDFRKAGLRIATAESCTGGLLAGALTQVAGSSDVFDRGFVTYSYPSKTQLLGVPADMLEAVGAVSPEVAEAMAKGALENSDAHVAVSITGVAGPGASEMKPEGLVYFGISTQSGIQNTIEKKFGPVGRSNVRMRSVEQALDMLLAQI